MPERNVFCTKCTFSPSETFFSQRLLSFTALLIVQLNFLMCQLGVLIMDVPRASMVAEWREQGPGGGITSKYTSQVLGWLGCWAAHHPPDWAASQSEIFSTVLSCKCWGGAILQCTRPFLFFWDSLLLYCSICLPFHTEPHWFLLLIWHCWLHKYKFYGLLPWLYLKCFPLCQFPMHFWAAASFLQQAVSSFTVC